MRSLHTLVALAIAGSLDLVAAGNCKPSGTATGTVPPSTTTEVPVVVTNVMINGDYGGYDPRAYGGIYAFEGGGEAKLLQGPGYQGDGSRENNCVQLRRRAQTSAAPAKRDTPPENAWIQQRLEDMEPSDYTVRFWYVVMSNALADTCRIEGFYGGDMFGATPYFPVVEDAVGDNWVSFVELMPVTTASGMIRFELSCVDGGAAEVYFDQVFVSNQVSPDDMDNISLFFPTARHAATVPPGQSTTLAATTSGELTSTEPSTSMAETATETSTGTEDTGIESTTASASPTDSASPSGSKLCAKLVPGAPGRGCAKRPYNSNQGYKRFPESSILREQCAALCLADTNCQSFEWTYKASGCGNTCVLIAALRDDGPTNGGSDAAWAYDRTCIEETECSPQPDGTVCVNVVADTPSSSCTQLKGKAKACAKPFLTVGTRMFCGLTNECRDLCAKYPSCKSYAATFGSCSLYDARSSEVAEAGPDSFWFTDMDCHACGEGNAHFQYLTPLQDPANMPVWSCPAVEPETSAGISTTADPVSETSSVGISESTTTANVPGPDSSLSSPSTTVTSPPTTTDTDDNCPQGIASPGACFRASPTPDSSTCWKNGIPEWIDAYGRSLEDFPNQNTVEDCAVICKQDSMCKAFGFEATARLKCRFSPEVMADAHFVEDSSNPVVWNDMKCMTCIMCGEDSTPTTTKPASPPEITCAVINDGRGCRYKNNDEFPQDGNGRPVKPFVCMSNGSINQEPWSPAGDWPFQNSIPQCAAICAQVPNCKASAWNRRTNRCEFISSSLKDAGYRGVEGSEVFWSDNECWDCSGLCDDDSGETGTSTGSWSTQSATTMLTSTRPVEDGPSTTQPATSEETENTTSRTPTTTGAASQPDPTDCAVPSASLSDNVTCGIPGAAGNQVQTYRLQDFSIRPVGSLGTCASLCLQRADCQGIEYNRQDTVCYLYRVGPADLGVQYNTQSTRRFYDRGCFKCA